ncbi:PTAC2 [Symbiodinium sp. CCMP2592]|nr:PTAC2 [Symbiodinium sp. CCMP2592]
MPSNDLVVDDVTFSAAQSALQAGRQWQRSLDLFAFMSGAKISPSLMSYSAALSACQKGALWQQAMQLRQEFLSSRICGDVIPHNACISACAKPARWDLALAVFRSLPMMQLTPSIVSYSAMITCLEKGWQWRMVVELLEELGSSDLIMSADVAVFSAAISALEKGLQWQSALKTFGIMANKSILPNAICYNATMSACQRHCGAPVLVLRWPRDGPLPTFVTAICLADEGFPGRALLPSFAACMRQGKLYTPLIPLVLIGVALIYVGTAPARDFSQGEAQAVRQPWVASRRLHRGTGLASDISLLRQHHGSMPPKANTDKAKASGKGQKGEHPQVSKIDFALPAAVSTSLQSIATRSTQDLWGSHAFSLEDATAEQLAQRRANAISKLSKRLTGNVRAKDELGLALQHWCVTIGQHLLGLIGRTRAVCTKIDEDTAQAVQEMNEALVHQPSSTSLDKVSLATASMGMSWTEVQETEIQRIAAALRAFAVVQSPGTAAAGSGPPRTLLPGSGFGEASTALQLTHEHLTTAAAPEHRGYDRHSEASFGLGVNPSTAGASRSDPAHVVWPFAPAPGPEIPAAPPWLSEATGRTPEAPRRVPITSVTTSEPELVAAETPVALTWQIAWLSLLRFAVENGADPVGEVAVSAEQDAALPLSTDTQAAEVTLQVAGHVWQLLQDAVARPSETCLQDLHDGLRDVLYRARQFPVVLSKLPQGILVAAHVTIGGLLDPFAYAPATAQEWLFPEQLVEMGGACLGYLPTAASVNPHVQAVWPIGQHRGQPVFSTGSVPATTELADLAHVRFVEGPVIRNENLCRPAYLRDIGVFTPASPLRLYLLHADDRAHGHLLFLQVCEALGVQASAWHWHRIVETLPSLPPEQYVLLPNSMPWHRVLMPVDLRPLGGIVSLVVTERNQPCGNIVADAAAQQQLSIAEQDFLCRTCGAWFVPQAYTSMLPRGDTLQAWPVQRDRASARTEHGGSLSPRLSLEDVFSTSLSLPSPVDLAFHEENGANAVVLYTQGLHYTFAPVYADHLSIRSTVMGSFMHEVTSGGLEFSHFARILPPLDRLPAIQFVAMQCTVGQFPGVIDFRPLGGGLVVGAMARDSPPATRLKDAVASYGEPDASTSVMGSLATGTVPAPLVIVRRRQHGMRDELASPPSAGWRPTLSVAVCIGLSHLLGGRGLLFGLFWGASIATFLPPADPLQEGAIPISQEPIDGPPHSPENNLASITEHHKLAQRLQVFGDWEHVDVRCSLGLAHAPSRAFLIKVFAAGSVHSFHIRGTHSARDLRHALLRTSGAAGRKFPVPVLASLNSRYVAFVAPARDAKYVTILVDSGGPFICLDVPADHPGQHILEALVLLHPGHPYRLGEGTVFPLRNGDVVVAHAGAPEPPVEVGHLTVTSDKHDASHWLRVSMQVLITSPDKGLQLVQVPKTFTKGQLETGLREWYGPTRCGAAGLIRLPVAYPVVDLYCLPCHQFSTLTVLLSDTAECDFRPVVHSVSTGSQEPPELSHITQVPSALRGFWVDVMRRRPVILRHFLLTDSQTRSGQAFLFVHLGLDFCRAYDQGWRISQATAPPLLNLGALQPECFDPVGRPTAGHEQGTQTVPLHWPPNARPTPQGAMLQKRAAKDCLAVPGFHPTGPMQTLACPHLGVTCRVPCPEGHYPWALRIGEWVKAACTRSVDWQDIMNLGGLTTWDLPGVEVHGQSIVWKWPGEVYSLAGECGHLLHDGQDPFVCDASRDTSAAIQHVLQRATTQLPVGSIGLLVGGTGAGAVPRHLSCFRILALLLLSTPFAAGTADVSSPEPEEPSVTPVPDSTPASALAWCHELSCQTTHCSIDASDLWEYCRQHAPDETLRVNVWSPFQGPSTFDVAKAGPLSTFCMLLREAGHRAETCSLHVAYDTLPTQLDVVSCPADGPAWWIVRDGLARELLRPVAPWYESDGRRVLTVNSLGQAQGLSFGGSAGALHRLATGVRAICTYPFTRVIGHLTAHDLVLTEIAVGSVAFRRHLTGVLLWGLLFFLWPSPAAAMQQEVAIRSTGGPSPGWGARLAPVPTLARIWTHTLSAPTVMPYVAAPDPAVMAQCVANTARGVPASGDFVWTTPQVVQGVAHLLHVPSGSAPPMIYWLLNYRGRGTVFGAASAIFDWQQIGQAAADDFGLPFFAQGHFAVWHGNRVITYGTQVPVPVHGTIITLVRQHTGSSAGLSAWDTPVGAPLTFHFDYDICRGPCGELPMRGDVDLQVRPVLPSASTNIPPSPEVHRVEPAPAATAGDVVEHSLVRQVNEVSHQLTMLTTRLESAGVLQGIEAEEGPQEPRFRGPEADAESQAKLRTSVSSWVFTVVMSGFCVATRAPSGLCMLVWLPCCRGDGDSETSEEPQPPSSPSLTAVTAPTPDTELIGTGGPDPYLVRPSDDAAARTGAPTIGAWPLPIPAFCLEQIPQLQTRVCAFLCEVDDRSNRLSPFLPAGCPLVLHNPFTNSDQCSVRTQLTGSGQIFRFFLQDFAHRRGWQPIVPVQPQPDEHAIHLIPAAAEPNLASVVLRTPQGLHATCLHRTLPSGPSRALTLGGRFGRLREPYPTRRLGERPVHLRDGDCLLLDQGPFGPPPPTPVRSATGLGSGIFLSCFRYRGCFPLLLFWLLPFADAMQGVVMPSHSRHRPGLEVGRYPWRLPPHERTLQVVAQQAQVRCTLLCPLTGLQGVYEVPSQSTYTAIRQHYQAVHGQWLVDVVPVWPAPRDDRLLFIPDIGAGSRCVCVVAQQEQALKAILVPGRCTYECLLRSLQHLSGWHFERLRLPPALHNQLLLDHAAELQLRNADVFLLGPAAIPADAAATHISIARPDRIPWDVPFTTVTTEIVAVWLPDTRFPIFTNVPGGSVWLPDTGTFSGAFSTRHPGRWIPVAWHPAQCVHFVQAADRRGRAHILHESHEGVLAVSFTSRTSRTELAEEFHTLPEHISVLGATPDDTTAPLALRDGDIVFDSYLYEPPGPAVWNIGAADRPHLHRWVVFAFVCAISRLPTFWGILPLLPLGAATRMERSRSSGSAASSADSSATLSPRAGCWRPETPQPMHEVLTHGRAHYCILSPFHAGGTTGYFLRETSGDDLDGRVALFCGGWSRRHVLLGPTIARQPLVMLPGGLQDLATIVVHTGERRQAHLVPRRFSWRELHAYVKVKHPNGNHLVSAPAVARYRALPSLPIDLRDGDSFSWRLDPSQPHAVSLPSRPRYAHWLPHLDAWHSPFVLKHGAWVFVWQPQRDPLFQCERRWIPAGSAWLPGSLQFCRPRCAPGSARWVPVSHYDGRCHFVQQSPSGCAHVLAYRPFSGYEPECWLIDNPASADAVPQGWQLAHHIQCRTAGSALRDGDVLIPAPVPPLIPALSAFAAKSRGFTILFYLCVLGGWGQPTFAMFAPPEAQLQEPVRVGKFPWRLPDEDRALHDSIQPGQLCHVLSPYGVQGDPAVDLTPDDTVEDARVALTGAEPAWSQDIMPVFPAPVPGRLTFVPVAPAPSLACVLVLSVEWHLPLLIPSRADIVWLLGYLRSLSPGPILSVRAPVAAQAAEMSLSDAVHWRDGDLLLAFPTDAEHSAIDIPVFREEPLLAARIRHMAFWSYDFQVEAPLSVVLWRPGRRPTQAHVPSGSQWLAEACTFMGVFQNRYPGRWIPVAWAYDDRPHLCAQSSDTDLRNIIIETLQDEQLRGTCHTVHALANAATCGMLVDRVDCPCFLLGLSSEKSWPELRNGDIVHFPPTRSNGACAGIGYLVGLLVLLRPSWAALAVVWGTANLFPHVAATPSSPLSGRRAPSCLWCPFLGRRSAPNGPDRGPGPVTGLLHSDRYVTVDPAPWAESVHGVCCLGIPNWVTVLVVGPPTPRAVLLPSHILYDQLLQVARHHFAEVSHIDGNHPMMGRRGQQICLRDGDCLRVAQDSTRTVELPVGNFTRGWTLLWRDPHELYRILRAAPGQAWYPPLGSLLPAMLQEVECWWPWRSPVPEENIIHMLPRDLPQPLSGPSADGRAAHSSATSVSSRSCRKGFSLALFSTPLLFLSSLGRSTGTNQHGFLKFALLCLVCYLAAWGAPSEWCKMQDGTWHLKMQAACQLQAHLHQGWWTEGLADALPSMLPAAYHYAWQAEPRWQAGPPESLLIATDGSGVAAGSWAFIAWGFSRGRWYRLGWAAGSLPATPWLPSEGQAPGTLLTSYLAELAALQSAAQWCTAMCDLWQLRTAARPSSVSVVVDNASALQAAAGVGAVSTEASRRVRSVWQAVQARVTTHFRHVHSHMGVKVNTLADALATVATTGVLDSWMTVASFQACKAHAADLYPELWLIPRATMHESEPVFVLNPGPTDWIPPADAAVELRPRPAVKPPIELQILTANVQSIKDVRCNLFNPSGHGARRQYLLSQLTRLQADIAYVFRRLVRQPGVGVQADGSNGALVLTEANMAVKSGCAQIKSILRSSSQIDLRNALQHAPKGRGLVLGIDANGDFCAQDEGACLIGPEVARHEATSNDEHLFEFATSLGLEAPATWTTVQVGPGWSWEHTSGRRKRLDHLLFGAGAWTHSLASQAWDFDIVNSQRDHLALRVRTTLQPAAPIGRKCVVKRSNATDTRDDGASVWQRLAAHPNEATSSAELVSQLVTEHRLWVQMLAPKRALSPRQPYIQPRTLSWLFQLRDWRCQLRAVQLAAKQAAQRLVLRRWSRRPATERAGARVQHRHSRLLVEAMRAQERRLQAIAHSYARQDKQAHFLRLTAAATDRWHADGRPHEAIIKLRWASRRAAERRQVFSAGGFDIEAELEEQFRAQEAASKIQAPHIGSVILPWLQAEAPSCTAAIPTLLATEDACRRQKGNKAPGPDGIVNEFWSCFPVQAGRWTWEVLTRIALTGREPLHFKLALYCALYKKGPAALPKNYRAIALLNGIAKLWHGHLRRTVGRNVLRGYDSAQLGGKPGIPVGFAIAAFRAVTDLCVASQHCTAALFVDVQAAYYEVSRKLIFEGDDLEVQHGPRVAAESHLSSLAHSLRDNGALALLGVPDEERQLLHDCVAYSHWRLVGSDHVFLASKGSRPGDGLADILFGALFAVALRHIRRACSAEGITLQAAGSHIGADDTVLPIGWADDLAILADFMSPAQLRDLLPRFVTIAITTLDLLNLRINLGASKTEVMVDIRGVEATKIRSELLAAPAVLHLPSGHEVRISPEYRYLGVICTPRDTGRRDMELCAQRAHAAWSHAKSLLTCPRLPWRLKQAWVGGRVLPAAYATIATSIATSARALSPLVGFFERAARQLVESWSYGHMLSKPLLTLLLGLSSPEDAICIARVRLTVQLLTRAPACVGNLVDAVWNRATPWGQLLTEACQELAHSLPGPYDRTRVTSLLVRDKASLLFKACRHLSRYGSAYRALHLLWQDVTVQKTSRVLGRRNPCTCRLCGQCLPSAHALAAHIHRKHSVVNCLTQYTCGTVCLWCHADQHSTDRLKYHLKTSPACLHGLRVVVGPAYIYGTGTKRKGPRCHRGLPATRLPGPINATPAQRAAAEQARECTEDELRLERLLHLGVTEVDDWPDNALDHFDQGASGSLPAPGTDVRPNDAHAPLACAASLHATSLRCCFVIEAEQLAPILPSVVGRVVSPRWPEMVRQPALWRLPTVWHRLWKLWTSVHSFHPWDFEARSGFKSLRVALDATEGPTDGPPIALRALLSATVMFRLICKHVQMGAAVWICGRPSSLGTRLWRDLLPDAVFTSVSLSEGQVFLAAPQELLIPAVNHLRSRTSLFEAGADELVVRASSICRSFEPDGS